MALASKWLDLVVGLDLHLEITPIGPVPFPHPFVGIVGDPAASLVEEIVAVVSGWLSEAPPQPGMVTIAGFRATVTGDTASMPVPHIVIPPGIAWAPVPRLPAPPVGLRGKVSLPDPPLPPPSRASILLGSQTVKMMGANAVRTGELALGCSDPVPLPTSQVLSLGMPRPVLVGGPPGIDWQQALGTAGVRAARTSFAAAIEKVIPEVFARARSILPPASRVVTGHPVSVTTGSVLTEAIDFAWPALQLRRHYDSNWCDRASPVGFGWSHSLDVAVWIEEHAIVMRTEDGRELEFGTRGLADGVMRRGDVLWHEVDRVTLRAFGELRWEVERADGVVIELGPVAGERTAGLARMLRMRAPDGEAVRFVYDASARLVEAIDAADRRVAFEHDARGRLRKVWLPAPMGEGVQLCTELSYSDDGDLVEVRDAAGHATRCAYEGHLLVSETDRNGVAFHFRYDGFGPRARCVETWGVDPAAPDQAIHHHVLDYDRRNRRTIVTTSLGAAQVFAYDAAFMVTKVIDPRGGATVFERDRAHRVLVEVDALGRRTTRGYDERGALVRLEQPGGRVSEFRRDEHGRVVCERSPAGAEVSRVWDRFGRVAAEVDAAGHRTECAYADGRWVAVIDAAGLRTAIEHDDAGNLSGVTRPDGATWRWAHDAHGRVVAETDPTGAVTRWTYDAIGRAVRAEMPDGNAVERLFDAEGNVVRERDRACDVTMTRRGRGWLTSHSVGGETVRFEYDAEGRWIAVVNAAGQRHVRERDLAGAVRRELAFDGAAIVFDRDVLGRVTKIVRASGRSTKLVWSEAGLVERVEHGGGPTIEYAWREDGALLRAACDDLVVELERDALGRVLKETCGEDWVASTYEHRGLRASLASSRGAVHEIVRNAVGDPERVVVRDEAHRCELVFSRDARGREIDRRLPGGARVYWWRDGAGRPTQQFVGLEGGAHRLRRWDWGPGARVCAIEDGGERCELEHDARGVLAAATRGEEVQRRRRESDEIPRDADGRALAFAGARLHWDGAGRLVQVDRADGSSVGFGYDAFGRRVLRNAAGRVTRWQWDGDVPLHEWSEDGEAVPPREPPAEASRRAARLAALAFLQRTRGHAAEAAWLDGLRADADSDPIAARLLAEHLRVPTAPPPLPEAITWVFDPDSFAPMLRLGSATGTRAIVCDHLGTPSRLVDDEGAIVWTAELDVYGRVRADPQACPFRFPGQYDDHEVGLAYNRHRWYAPQHDAYATPDPIGLAGGLSPYAYVDDPIVQCDPLGLCITVAPQIDLRSPVAFPEPPSPRARAVAPLSLRDTWSPPARDPAGVSPGIDAAVAGRVPARDLDGA